MVTTVQSYILCSGLRIFTHYKEDRLFPILGCHSEVGKIAFGIWQIHVVKLASVWTIVLCSSSSICIYGSRRYSRIPLKSKKIVHIRVHKRTSRVHKRVRKSTTEIRLPMVIVKQRLQGYYNPIQNMIAWGVKVFYNRNKAISCLPRIGNFSRAIYRLEY